MNHVRIHGDPFGDGPSAGQLRSFLRAAVAGGLRCGLSLSGVRRRAPAPGETRVPLSDGVQQWEVGTNLPPPELAMLARAAGEAVAATAPVMVFGDDPDVAAQVGLEWRDACAVIVVGASQTAAEVVTRVRAELRWAGAETPAGALREEELQGWLALPAPSTGGPFVHCASDVFAGGTDLLVDVWAERFAAAGHGLRLVLPGASGDVVQALRERAVVHGAALEVLVEAFAPRHVADAVGVVLPCRLGSELQPLVQALASARPVIAARFAATARVLEGRGVALPIGGRNLDGDAGRGAYFAPDPRAIAAAMRRVVEDPASPSLGARGRRHAVAECVAARPGRPAAALPALGDKRPTVVLEAPLLETSSSAELTLATAAALHRRGDVDVRLVPTAPFRHDLGWLRGRAPELVPLLCRNPGRPDLWLSAGWPVRAARPDCRTWALRVDWEYGALPVELAPHVTQEADAVVVHSEHVYRTLTAAGRSMHGIHVVPHGVDAAMHEDAPPHAAITQWKGDRPAVLFCGGMIWRKGFDVFLRAALEARAGGADFVCVVKSIGAAQHYGGQHLGALAERFQRTPGAPPLLVIDEELSRAQLASVFAACDVLLHPYRGEGFCMPVLEARACGLPVLATRGGSTTSLMHGPGALEIPSAQRPVELGGVHVSQPWVLEPDAAQAAAQLRSVLHDLPAWRRAGRRTAPAVRTAFSWDAAAAELVRLAGRGVAARRVDTPDGEPVVTIAPLPRVAVVPGSLVGT
ncbi:MAG: glycosyltransferase [Planctomycetes bacterium]|nr:glycosyltransferase [Planctomycetota bacterium]